MKLSGLLAAGVVSLGVFIVCLLIVPGLKATFVGLIGIPFCGIVIVKIAADMIWPGVRVVINDQGIEDRRLRIGVVPWEEITAIEVRRQKTVRFLCLTVLDSSKYTARMPRHYALAVQASALLGFPPISIGFAGLTPGTDDALKYIVRHHPTLVSATDDLAKN